MKNLESSTCCGGNRDCMALQLYKGVGEMKPEQLRETAIDPESRMLKQVTVLNADGKGLPEMQNSVAGRIFLTKSELYNRISGFVIH